MNRFKEIRNLYKIEEIKDEYVLLQINKRLERLFIYEVEPVLFLDLSIDMQENIINVYNQILRECEFNVQIIISNKKLNIQNYIEKYLQYKKNIPYSMYKLYMEDIREKLDKENIYETQILISFIESAKEETKCDNFEKIIYKLEEIGCKIKKISNKKEYESILYEFLNKV